MSDLPYFPDDDYDEVTGEYKSAFDFEPTFTNTFWLDAAQTIRVTVESFTPDAIGPAFDALEKIVNLAAEGVFEPGFNQDNPQNYPEIPDTFDPGDKDVRSGFLDNDAVQNFLKKSGLKGIAQVYYDSGNNEFHIKINTNPSRQRVLKDKGKRKRRKKRTRNNRRIS